MYEYRHTSYVAQNQIICATSVAESLGLTLTGLTQLSPKATELDEMTQNNGHYAVQDHSRSPILVPIKSPYATSY